MLYISGVLDPTRLTTIINGRGKSSDGEPYPLTVFTINHGDRIRIRATHPGSEYAYYLQVDDHELYVTASDGYDIAPLKVRHIQLQPGESMDFEMDADQPVGNYWMRLQTIKDTSDGIIREGLAIVRYSGAPEEEPTTTVYQCTADSPCDVFNCPFAGFADSEYKNCLTFNNATSTLSTSELNSKFGISDPDYEEHFYQFISQTQGMNGKRFIEPSLPLYQPHDGAIVPCEDADCNPLCRLVVYISTSPTSIKIFFNVLSLASTDDWNLCRCV